MEAAVTKLQGTATAETATTTSLVDRSTLTLLEHVNLDVPSHEYIIPFYYEILGCGVDPRMAGNFTSSPQLESTIWANCGASQFHLCFSPETPPTLLGKIGLRFDSLEGLKSRIEQHIAGIKDDESKQQCFDRVEYGKDSQGNPQITLVDRYHNVFVCRTVVPSATSASMAQPILSETSKDWPELAKQLGRQSTDCKGIDYLEIACPKGTAQKIATFYESVFDATTNVVSLSEQSKIAMIALGSIQSTGRADQYLLFKEDDTPNSSHSRKGHQHHIAIYVGETMADFNQAYKNAEMAGVVWINPRFADKVDTLKAAQDWNQFRLKDVVDLETGQPILELEHEIRSLQHGSYPGRRE